MGGRGAVQRGIKGGKWDNYNSIINKICIPTKEFYQLISQKKPCKQEKMKNRKRKEKGDVGRTMR